MDEGFKNRGIYYFFNVILDLSAHLPLSLFVIIPYLYDLNGFSLLIPIAISTIFVLISRKLKKRQFLFFWKLIHHFYFKIHAGQNWKLASAWKCCRIADTAPIVMKKHSAYFYSYIFAILKLKVFFVTLHTLKLILKCL